MDRLNTLETIDWAEKYFGSLNTGGPVRRRDVDRLIAAGLAESVGMVQVCDGDGFAVLPERYREGFKMTEKGREELKRLRAI